MKIPYFLLLACVVLFAACSNSGCGVQNQNTGTAPANGGSTVAVSSSAGGGGRNSGVLTPADSAKVLAIEKYTTSISKGQAEVRREKANVKVYDDKDFAKYTYRNDSLLILVTTLHPPDQETRDFYFFNEKGQLVMHKHREWLKLTHPPVAREVVCYLDEKGVFYTMDRKMELGLGDNPSPMLMLPFTPLKLDADSLQQAIEAKFELFQAAAAKK